MCCEGRTVTKIIFIINSATCTYRGLEMNFSQIHVADRINKKGYKKV